MARAKTNASQLQSLVKAGYDLIPLKGSEKAPKDKNWTRRPYKAEDQLRQMEQGNNVGVRLKATDLVIDVDPRNFGEGWETVDPFSKLMLRAGAKPEDWPNVETGGGGKHYYLRKPEEVSVVDSLKDFPGVEFKTLESR
jgi:hypothetical protein